MLTHRLCDRFLIHIIVKHVPEPGMTVQRNHEKTLATSKSALVQSSVTYRLWSPEKRRNGYNIGWYAKQKWGLRGVCPRQNGTIQRFIISYHLHGRPERTDQQAKAKVLARLEVATRENDVCLLV